jgi:hypothetical protein
VCSQWWPFFCFLSELQRVIKESFLTTLELKNRGALILCARNGDLSFVSSVNCRGLLKTTWITYSSYWFNKWNSIPLFKKTLIFPGHHVWTYQYFHRIFAFGLDVEIYMWDRRHSKTHYFHMFMTIIVFKPQQGRRKEYIHVSYYKQTKKVCLVIYVHCCLWSVYLDEQC